MKDRGMSHTEHLFAIAAEGFEEHKDAKAHRQIDEAEAFMLRATVAYGLGVVCKKLDAIAKALPSKEGAGS